MGFGLQRARLDNFLRSDWHLATRTKLVWRACNGISFGAAGLQRDRAWRGGAATGSRLARPNATGLRLARRGCNGIALGETKCNGIALGEAGLQRDRAWRGELRSPNVIPLHGSLAKRVLVAEALAKRVLVATPPRQTRSRCKGFSPSAIPLHGPHAKHVLVARASRQTGSRCTIPHQALYRCGPALPNAIPLHIAKPRATSPRTHAGACAAPREAPLRRPTTGSACTRAPRHSA